MVTIEKVEIKDKQKLYNLNQKYLYEMTNFYDNEFDELGNIDYGYFDQYFIDLDNRVPFFIYNDSDLVGFVFINKYSFSEKPVDWVIAEATIFPMYRRNHFMIDATHLIFKDYKGIWEIKYNTKNEKAMKLWNKITKEYNPEVIIYSENERVLRFTID